MKRAATTELINRRLGKFVALGLLERNKEKVVGSLIKYYYI